MNYKIFPALVYRQLTPAYRWVVAYCFLNAVPLLRMIPKIWATIVLIGFFVSLYGARSAFMIWKRYTWLWGGLGITGCSLVFFSLVSSQPTPSEQLYYFLRACPFVLFGLVVASSEGRVRDAILAITLGNAIAAGINMYFNFKAVQETGITAGKLYHSITAHDMSVVDYNVLFWHSLMALTLSLGLSFALFDLLQKRSRTFALFVVSLIVIILSVVTSGFTATVIVMIVGFCIVIVRERAMLYSWRLIAFVLVASLSIGVLYLGRDISSSLDFVWVRISSFGDLLVGSADIIDIDTSGRWELGLLSWGSFMGNPLVGIVNGDVPVDFLVGGHSSIVDIPALYGFVGSIGPFFLVGMALYQTRPLKMDRKAVSVKGSLFVFWVMYLVSMVLDPVWLTAAIDFYAFFAFGLTAGITGWKSRNPTGDAIRETIVDQRLKLDGLGCIPVH